MATIDDFVSVLPVTTSDVQIIVPQWRLEQGPTAVGYAYYQLAFGSNELSLTGGRMGGGRPVRDRDRRPRDDPSSLASALALVAGGLGLLERRRTAAA